jgi:hypothetical protein
VGTVYENDCPAVACLGCHCLQYSGESVARPGLKVVQSAICTESCQSDTVGGNHEPYRVYNKVLLHTYSTYCSMSVYLRRQNTVSQPESCQSSDSAMLHRTDSLMRHFTWEVVPMVRAEERERERDGEPQRDEMERRNEMMVSAFGFERQSRRRRRQPRWHTEGSR